MSDRIELKPYTIKQLAMMYNMTLKVFRGQLEPLLQKLGERVGHYYNVKQVTLIFKHLGVPGSRDEKDINP